MKLRQIIVSLTILRDQLQAKGYAEEEIEELTFTPDRIRIRKGGRILTIPLVSGDTLVGISS